MTTAEFRWFMPSSAYKIVRFKRPVVHGDSGLFNLAARYPSSILLHLLAHQPHLCHHRRPHAYHHPPSRCGVCCALNDEPSFLHGLQVLQFEPEGQSGPDQSSCCPENEWVALNRQAARRSTNRSV